MDELIYVQAHCDSRVLHAPGVCEYCDHHPEAQQRRIDLGVNFTSDTPDPNLLPCPAMEARGWQSLNGWGGNQPHNVDMSDEEIDALDAIERPVSKMFYGTLRERLGRLFGR